MDFIKNNEYFKGRGAQINTANRFLQKRYVDEHIEGLDEIFLEDQRTQYLEETPKNIISKNDSPDISFRYSINPYQGCEHGCIYCYARNSHEYWGYGAGLDFERKILIKKNAVELLEKQFNSRNYQPDTIVLSGNTDCYQPIERKLKITRSLLKLMLEYRHPVSLITKNSLILRDIDLLAELAKLQLVSVAITINSLNEELRQKMEPRTVTAKGRLSVIRKLSEAGVPVRLMCAPIIPGLNSDEMPELIRLAAENGAKNASFTMVRLNGAIADVFRDWVSKAYPDRADKVLHMIASCHGGSLNDSRWFNRTKGDGHIADSIKQLFSIAVSRYMSPSEEVHLRTDRFCPKAGKQTSLF